MIKLPLMPELDVNVVSNVFYILNSKVDLFTRLFFPNIGLGFAMPNALELTREPVNNGASKVLNLKLQPEHPLYSDFEAETEIGITTLFGNEAILPFSHALNVVLKRKAYFLPIPSNGNFKLHSLPRSTRIHKSVMATYLPLSVLVSALPVFLFDGA